MKNKQITEINANNHSKVKTEIRNLKVGERIKISTASYSLVVGVPAAEEVMVVKESEEADAAESWHE